LRFEKGSFKLLFFSSATKKSIKNLELRQMIITSLKELDKIVAKSLDWKEEEFIDDASWNGMFYEQDIKFLCPASGDEDFDTDAWIEEYGYCPNFSWDWSHTKFILLECDRQNLQVKYVRTASAIKCIITNFGENLNPIKSESAESGSSWNLPRLMSLSTVLAWLKFKGHSFLLNLPKSCINCKYMDMVQGQTCKHPGYKEVNEQLWNNPDSIPPSNDLEALAKVYANSCPHYELI
jgi:hypothetical protein